MATPKRPKLTAKFNIGGESAEVDALLESAFYPSHQFEMALSKSDYDCFLVGRTGAGKSAILRRLEDTNSSHVVRIKPEDLSLPYITSIDAFRYLDALDVNLDLLWIALWKHVILIEVLKHRYNVDSPEAKKNILDTLRSAVSRNNAKKLALDYLETFDGKFWAEADERVRQFTDGVAKKIAGEAAIGVFGAKVSASMQRETNLTHEEKRELGARFQPIVNDTQLPRLNKLIDMLDDDILDSAQNFVYVVIDDLDRDWVDDRLTNALMRCLLRAVLDFQRVGNMKVLVSLRTNIYENIDFGTKGAGQEEKIRALLVPIVWDRRSLTALLNERVKVASSNGGGNVQSASELLPHTNATRGNPLEYILDRTLLRPRDAISFFKECVREADGKSGISWDNILQAEKAYSRNRLMALRDEWKGNFPGIGKVFEAFRGAPNRMTRDEIADRIDSAILTLSDSEQASATWLGLISESVLSGRLGMTWEERYQPGLNLLFRLGLIGATSQLSDKPAFFNDDAHLMASTDSVASLRNYFVSRAYQSALDIRVGRVRNSDS